MSFLERFGLKRKTPEPPTIRAFPQLPAEAPDEQVAEAVLEVADWMLQANPTRPTIQHAGDPSLIVEYIIPLEASEDTAQKHIDAFINGDPPA